MRATLIDADYITRKGKAVIRLLLKRGRFTRAYFPGFEPYFYVSPRPGSSAEETRAGALSLRAQAGSETASPVRADLVEKLVFGEKRVLVRVFCMHPGHVRALREKARSLGEVFEADIVFARRFLIDNGLSPFQFIDLGHDGKSGKEFGSVVPDGFNDGLKLRTLAFDIEVYNPRGVPRPDKDPIIMLSYADEESGVITYKPVGLPFVKAVRSESEVIESFCRLVKEKDVELLVGYNDVEFDLPYLRDRAKALGAGFSLGRDGSSGFSSQQRGLFKHAKIKGRIHIDLYAVAKFLGLIGALKTKRITLADVYAELFGEEKKKVDKMGIWGMWDGPQEELKALAEYSLDDALAEKKVADKVLPLEMELAKLVGASLPDVCGATTGQLVEMLMWREAHRQNRVVPNKPGDEEAARRAASPVQGAFVKLPEAGIYEDLAVLDFRGMYPSIIISHNIDMDTLGCKCCPGEAASVSPLGHRFCSKAKGLVPSVLERLIDERDRLKKRMKALDPDSQEYGAIFARSQALKIISNSFYGFLLYPRSRWYSRPCGESVTAYGRHYIQETMRKAEEAGFKVLYGDTDSVILQLNGRPRADALAFMKSVNASLPGRMELELESFYVRGVFVGKKAQSAKAAEVGAKKKYALIDDAGRVKIRGFELVRRDWSRIARKTQRRVLEAILKEGSKEKAAAIVREVIADLKEGRVPLEECVIYTQVRKRLDNYAVKSPEVAAALKAKAAGIQVEVGTMVGYVITRKGKTISDKAEPAESAKDYDPNYYIENQVLPSVMKIMKELGYDESDLKMEGKQSALGEW
ncbi:MAG: DNA-directed DNA polymerase [Candidatus ainarchaeum sp.]|nr:DNA-directed DNA polymerase [Candidatus ainarchaeum sp.]